MCVYMLSLNASAILHTCNALPNFAETLGAAVCILTDNEALFV